MTVGIDGLADEEAGPLLRRLCEEATAPERVLRYRWRQGDAVGEHLAIMDAIERRDPDAAEDHARSHIRHARDTRLGMMFQY